MIRLGRLDQPDARKAHTRPVPKGGGVGVVAAFAVGCAMMGPAEPYAWAAVLATLGIAAVAFLDDLRDFSFAVKLGAQVLAAVAVVAGGLVVDRLNLPGVGAVGLGWASGPLTVLWFLYATNAMNFIDGLNGLAAGVSAIACAVLAAIAAALGGAFVLAAALALGAGLLGFLPFNFPRARIFMGDVGSQACGFVLAVLAVAAGRFRGVELSLLLVPMLLFGVLFDVAFTLVRRLLAHERVTQAHRSHLYQVAHRAGMDARAVTLVHWGFALWGGLCCAAFLAVPGWAKPAVALLVVPPQVAWLLHVAGRARRASLGPW